MVALWLLVLLLSEQSSFPDLFGNCPFSVLGSVLWQLGVVESLYLAIVKSLWHGWTSLRPKVKSPFPFLTASWIWTTQNVCVESIFPCHLLSLGHY